MASYKEKVLEAAVVLYKTEKEEGERFYIQKNIFKCIKLCASAKNCNNYCRFRGARKRGPQFGGHQLPRPAPTSTGDL